MLHIIMNAKSQGVASCELRVASEGSRLAYSPLPSDLQPLASSLQLQRRPRRAISLLEVLIAMFVMLFGLMGVAAIFPVGNHYAGKGDQYDRGAALAGSAFAELKARGILRPDVWLQTDGTPVIDQVAGGNYGYFKLNADAGHAFVVDPVGAAQASNAFYFPYNGSVLDGVTNPWQSSPIPLAGTVWPIRRVTLAAIPGGPTMSPQLAESIFRLRDDVAVELPKENDHPGIQRWATSDTQPDGTANNSPDYPGDDTPLARAYTGSYSWLATVVPSSPAALAAMQPGELNYGTYNYEVSVAVFYKREDAPSAASERALQAELGPGGDLVLYGADLATVDDASQDIRAGQWIALAGVHPTTGQFLLRWYRLLSYEDETDDEPLLSSGTAPGRRAMVEGPEWPYNAPTANPTYTTNLRAILLPGVIGVATQTLKLDTD